MKELAAPPDVQQAADERRLGALVDARKLTNPFLAAVGYTVLAVLSYGLASLMVNLATPIKDHLPRSVEKLIGFAGLALILFGCVCVVVAVVSLVLGNRSYFLWEGGFVYRRNGKVRAYPWAEINEVVVRRYETGDDAGKVYEYRVVPDGGRPIAISAELTDGHDAFNEALTEAVRAAGRPVAGN